MRLWEMNRHFLKAQFWSLTLEQPTILFHIQNVGLWCGDRCCWCWAWYCHFITCRLDLRSSLLLRQWQFIITQSVLHECTGWLHIQTNRTPCDLIVYLCNCLHAVVLLPSTTPLDRGFPWECNPRPQSNKYDNNNPRKVACKAVMEHKWHYYGNDGLFNSRLWRAREQCREKSEKRNIIGTPPPSLQR